MDTPDKPTDIDDFEYQAEQENIGFFREFWDFLCYEKKWWLAPIIVVLLIISGLLIFGATPGGLFIYHIF